MDSILYFDGHCDTISHQLCRGGSLLRNGGHVDLERAARLGGYAQIFAIFADSAKYRGSGFLQADWQHSRLFKALTENVSRVAFCRTAAEIEAAVCAGRTAVLLGIEGGELLDCDKANIPAAAHWGVRYVTLTWNHANAISGTNREEPERGLSAPGREFVRTLYANGIYADVSHLSDAGFWDLVHMKPGPILATHSNSRAVCPHPRNLTDDMFRAVRDSGGVVGLNFCQDFVGGDPDSAESLLRHADRFLSLGGEDTLCFGGDFDGCDTLCGGVRGLQSIPALYETFRSHGYDRPLLDKLFFQNWLRMFR